MRGVEVGVVGRPRVVHRDTAEPRQDAGVVDALAAALGMAGDQGVLAGAGAVHPVQLPGHAQPGLVEPGHLGGGDPVGDLGEEPVEPGGGAVMAATVASDTGVPNSSASAWAVRFLDRNCPTYR